MAEPKFSTPEVVRVFPTFVWKALLLGAQRDTVNAAIRDTLHAIRRGLPDPGPGETWQSNHGLHELEALRGFVSCVESAVETVLDFLKIGYDEYEITGCWATLSTRGAAHRMHAHPNNFLSGVYYVQVHDGANTINFHDPRPQTGIMRPPVTELTHYNTDQVVFKVEDGTLLVFPAWLPHSVDASGADRLRISVSFNVMFSRFGETLGRPLWGER